MGYWEPSYRERRLPGPDETLLRISVLDAQQLFYVTCMRRSRKSKTDDLFIRANKEAEAGNLKAAFRLYLAAAKAGDSSCQINLGNLYDEGSGVRRNRSAAMFGTNVLIDEESPVQLTILESCGEMRRNTEKH